MKEDEIYKEIERRKQIKRRTQSDPKTTFTLIIMVLGLVGVAIGGLFAGMSRL